MTVIKGKQVLTHDLRIRVELRDVEYTTGDEKSRYIHFPAGQEGRDAHQQTKQRLENLITGALQQLEGVYSNVEVVFGYRAELGVVLDEENQRLDDELARQEFEEWNERADRITDIGREIGVKETIWSMNDDASQGLLDDDTMFDHKNVMLVLRGGWGDNEPLYSGVMASPSYRDVWKAADQIVQRSNDKHHIFLEAATPVNEKQGVLIVDLCFGS